MMSRKELVYKYWPRVIIILILIISSTIYLFKEEIGETKIVQTKMEVLKTIMIDPSAESIEQAKAIIDSAYFRKDTLAL